MAVTTAGKVKWEAIIVCFDFFIELAAVSADGSRYRDGNKDGNCTEDADEMARPSCVTEQLKVHFL